MFLQDRQNQKEIACRERLKSSINSEFYGLTKFCVLDEVSRIPCINTSISTSI